MSANLRNYTTTIFGFDHVMRLVPAGAWDNASPCEGWTARDVAGHAMGVVNNVAARSGMGANLDVFTNVGEIAGDDPYATWYEIRNRFLEAMDRPGALQTEIMSSSGATTIDAFAGQMVADTLIHTWDLARAAGVDERLDPTLVRLVHDALLSRDPAILRAPGRYAAVVPGSNDADAQTALLLFSGRTV